MESIVLSAEKKIIALEKLLEWCFEQLSEEGMEIDSWDMQEKMEELGFVVIETYDPEKHKNIEAEDGDTVWVKTELALVKL